MALDDQEIDLLEELLFSEELEEDTLDYFGLHGLICASIVGPKRIDTQELIDIVFADQQRSIPKDKLEIFHRCSKKIAADVLESLNEGKEVNLPHEHEEEYEACLESWCTGFMEGFFHFEKVWFQENEEVTAELLLPIMALSGLFDSEEFDAIEKNEKLMTQFASLVGDQLTDIYLFYHAKK